jgi:hypothetical protein
MNETERLLHRQAEWQRDRQKMSWPDKIRQAAQLRATIEAFRVQRLRRSADAGEFDAKKGPRSPETQ